MKKADIKKIEATFPEYNMVGISAKDGTNMDKFYGSLFKLAKRILLLLRVKVDLTFSSSTHQSALRSKATFISWIKKISERNAKNKVRNPSTIIIIIVTPLKGKTIILWDFVGITTLRFLKKSRRPFFFVEKSRIFFI